MNTQPSYQNQTAWREIQSHLPPRYHLIGNDLPSEEIWNWQGHQIHLDRYRRPESPVRVILFHGVGSNGRQMSTILGHPLAQSGIEVVAIDMPTYGVTRVAPGKPVTYDDWGRREPISSQPSWSAISGRSIYSGSARAAC